MEREVYRIYDELKRANGRENAITAETLAGRYFTADENGKRKVRKFIREIRRSERFDNVIVSCNDGYFWATNEDIATANNRLFAQAFDLLKTAYANQKKAEKNGQILIQLTPYQRKVYESIAEDF